MPYGKGTYGSKVGRPKKKVGAKAIKKRKAIRGAATATSKLGKGAKKRKVLSSKPKKGPKMKYKYKGKKGFRK